MRIREYIKPKSLREAYELLKISKKSMIIAGGAYLRLNKREIPIAIDIEGLGLDYIIEENNYLKIGSMTTLRELKINEYTKNELGGILSNMVKQIGGVQLRNLATIGGSICGKYSFSDILPSLVALNADLRFYNKGIISIDSFLNENIRKDILLEVIIDLNQKGLVKYFKKTYKEYSLINLALVKNENGYRLAIGSRPGRAKYAKLTSKILTEEEDIDSACKILFDELDFKTDYRVSLEYRKSLAETYLREAFKELVV